jgi:putative ABC transport system permease protein
MYTVVLERTHEIGILKALGASRWTITALFMRESLAIAFVGILLGVGSTYAVKSIVTSLRPTLSIVVTTDWLLQALALALIGCLAGALYPALRAAGAEAAAILAYE